MNKQNFQLFCDELIKENISQNKRPKLLLHACCAPCSSSVLELISEAFDITVFFYNPNITDLSEYDLRLDELKRFMLAAHPNIKIIDGGFFGEYFFDSVKGYENEKEGGARCRICYYERLKKTAELAKSESYDYFCTTLSVSPYKNSAYINEFGEKLQNEIGCGFLFSDFKKHGGYARSIELSKIYGLYRQNYCGCAFSKR